MKCETCNANLIHYGKLPSDWKHEDGNCVDYLKNQNTFLKEGIAKAHQSAQDALALSCKRAIELALYKKQFIK